MTGVANIQGAGPLAGTVAVSGCAIMATTVYGDASILVHITSRPAGPASLAGPRLASYFPEELVCVRTHSTDGAHVDGGQPGRAQAWPVGSTRKF